MITVIYHGYLVLCVIIKLDKSNCNYKERT
nr:MAG TPA: hypothetical protein [Caudoviricetes sp.]DAM95435.1 MAG TPA: hypothetical protein [Caudoviricetes sp.]